MEENVSGRIVWRIGKRMSDPPRGLLQEASSFALGIDGRPRVVDSPANKCWVLGEGGSLHIDPLLTSALFRGRYLGCSFFADMPLHFCHLQEPNLILVWQSDGRLRGQVELSALGPLSVWSATALDENHWVFGVSLERPVRQAGLLIKSRSTLEWMWKPASEDLRQPTGISSTLSGNILVADSALHVVLEVDNGGYVMWRYGKTALTKPYDGFLCAPEHAITTDRGVLVADTMNDRVIEVSRQGKTLWRFGEGPIISEDWQEDPLSDPCRLLLKSTGSRLVADRKNGRVLELSASGEVLMRWGCLKAPDRLFSFPRTIQLTPRGSWLVADSNHNRVIEVSTQNRVLWRYPSGLGQPSILHWPRSATLIPENRILIADGLNGRVVVVTRNGHVVRTLAKLDDMRTSDIMELGDPHDAQLLDDGNILITDTLNNSVVEVSPRNGVVWRYDYLKDPHQAVRLPDGRTRIADSGRNRIVWVDRAGDVVKLLAELRWPNGTRESLSFPRFVLGGPGWLVIATDNGAIYFTSDEGEIMRQIGPEVGDGNGSYVLRPSRGMHLAAGQVLAVSDCEAHEVLGIAWDSKRSG